MKDMYADKSIRIGAGTYELLKDIKKVTGKPIKRIVADLVIKEKFKKK